MKFRLPHLPGSMRCSFCRRPNRQVEKLISNHPHDMRRTYICDACVAVCDAVLQGDYRPLGNRVYRVAQPDSPRRVSRCSFCRKPQHEAGKLLFSRMQNRAICPACVAVCNSILSGENPNSSMPQQVSGKLIADEGVRATQKHWWHFWRKISAIGFAMVSPEFQPQQARHRPAWGAAASPAQGVAL